MFNLNLKRRQKIQVVLDFIVLSVSNVATNEQEFLQINAVESSLDNKQKTMRIDNKRVLVPIFTDSLTKCIKRSL